jgi:guanyl-specific ribonuclease Sa
MQSSQPLVNFKHVVIEFGNTKRRLLDELIQEYKGEGFTVRSSVWSDRGVYRVILEDKKAENFLYNPNWSRPTY